MCSDAIPAAAIPAAAIPAGAIPAGAIPYSVVRLRGCRVFYIAYIVYKLSGKIRLEYKDIINFGSLFQDNKSESRFKIGTDSTKIDIDTMKHAVRFSVSTSRTGDKIHKEIMEFIPEIEKLF